jgi:hypothetical protein
MSSTNPATGNKQQGSGSGTGTDDEESSALTDWYVPKFIL